MQRVAHAIQLHPKQAKSNAVRFAYRVFVAFEFQHYASQALSGLIVQLVSQAQAFLLLCLYESAAQIIALGRGRIQSLLLKLSPRNVDDRDHDELFGARIDGVEADLHREFRAVLSQPKEIASLSHGSGLRIKRKRLPQSNVFPAKSFRNEDFNLFSNQFLGRIAKLVFYLR